ncbi:DUF2752 domain-containing protein [Ulvibacter sp. MAR_2010_11]|uniref:DUF2752 domain-containing protein n=1 Tax=Ulvibacter sp. MAR_2010_11 TaxID=1250229 RepID=UPI001E3F0AA4|nr:DUF2752 domain-containing protein [Ulvibacter sp. MAR_2010_11]
MPFSPTAIKISKITLLLLLLGGGFVFFYLFNPSQHSFFLPCPFKYLTGFNCPGCGSQRAIHHLLHGDVFTAFGLNPLLILSLPLILYSLGLRLWNYIFKTELRVQLFYSNVFIYIYFGIAIIYWFIRNLSFYPFAK